MGSRVNLLNARIVGSGQEYLVLSNGFGTDQTVWADFVPWLGERYRVVLYDLACTATVSSSAFDPRRHADLDGYAGDVLDLLAELGIDRCTFVGHSVSGAIGLLASLRRPEAIERIIMLGASPRYLNDEGYHGGFDEAGVAAMVAAIGTDLQRWADQFAPVFTARSLDDMATRSFLGTLRRMQPDVAMATFKMILSSDIRERIGASCIPVVILQTLDDPAVPFSAARYFLDHIEGSVMEMLDAEGHLPHLTAPDIVGAALRRHLPPFMADAAARLPGVPGARGRTTE